MCEIQVVKIGEDNTYPEYSVRLAGYANQIEEVHLGSSLKEAELESVKYASLLQWKVVQYEEEVVTERRLKKV